MAIGAGFGTRAPVRGETRPLVGGSTGYVNAGGIGSDFAAQQIARQAEVYRKQSEEESRRRQEEINRKERERMAMEAARNALSTQSMLMTNNDNPRTTDGQVMQISNYGDVGLSGSSSRSSRSTGGSGSSTSYAAPPIDTSKIEALLTKYSPSPVAPPTMPAPVAAPAPPTKAANTAKAFANAKNISGRQGAAAIRALHDVMTRRGMSDSGLEAEGEAGIMGDVLRFNSDAAFESDLADDERNWDAAQLGYQGALGQRNADMGFLTSGYQGQISQRGQDLDRLNLALSYLSPRLY